MPKDMSTNTVNNELKVGSIAPDFSLFTQSARQVNLYQVLDSGKKVLLIFYPKDMTPGCTVQLCGVRDTYSDYAKYEIEIFGVNQDSSESHQRFIDTHQFQFDILIDEDRQVAKQYGAIKHIFGNIGTKRGVFLINTDRTILYQVWGQQDNSEVLEVLKQNS
jgi:thioredoxin-dependent peroxiredoxin